MHCPTLLHPPPCLFQPSPFLHPRITTWRAAIFGVSAHVRHWEVSCDLPSRRWYELHTGVKNWRLRPSSSRSPLRRPKVKGMSVCLQFSYHLRPPPAHIWWTSPLIFKSKWRPPGGNHLHFLLPTSKGTCIHIRYHVPPSFPVPHQAQLVHNHLEGRCPNDTKFQMRNGLRDITKQASAERDSNPEPGALTTAPGSYG